MSFRQGTHDFAALQERENPTPRPLLPAYPQKTNLRNLGSDQWPKFRGNAAEPSEKQQRYPAPRTNGGRVSSLKRRQAEGSGASPLKRRQAGGSRASRPSGRGQSCLATVRQRAVVPQLRREEISSLSMAISSSTVMTVVSSVSRLRTETVPSSTSFAPMISM